MVELMPELLQQVPKLPFYLLLVELMLDWLEQARELLQVMEF